MIKKDAVSKYERFFIAESEYQEIDELSGGPVDAVLIVEDGKPPLLHYHGKEISFHCKKWGIRYNGENTQRTMLECPSHTGLMQFDLIEELAHFEFLIAMDTNTGDIDGERVSCGIAVSSPVKTIVAKDLESNSVRLGPVEICKYILGVGVPGNPETKAWRWLLENLSDILGKYASVLRIGLIVDSEIGKHAAFNKREEPIDDDFYLPENVTLIYASPKLGARPGPHKLIKVCHKVSHTVLEKIRLYGAEGIRDYVPNIREFKDTLEGQ